MKASTLHRVLALGALLLLGACPASTSGGGARRHAQPPSASDLEGVTLVELQLQPRSPAATRYGAPVEHALTEVEQALADALADAPLVHVPALSRMARELAVNTHDRANVPPPFIEGLMAWAGLVDPSPKLEIVDLPEDPEGCYRQVTPGCRVAVDSLAEMVRTSLPDDERVAFGVGVAGGPGARTRMIVAVLERGVELDPLPVSVGREGAFALAGRLLGARTKPRIEVVGPGGRATTIAANVAANGRFSARLSCDDGPGAYQVEVLAEGRYGVEVVANFPVYCGTTPPTAITVVMEALDPSVGAEQIARANFLYLNEERRARGLPALEWSAEAAAIAHAHSVDMLEHGFVGHTSPTTGGPGARFQAAGLSAPDIRENVARGYGPKGIHDSLMNSPGHRVNILATDMTHVGVGVVVGPPETDVAGAPRPVFATQNYFRKPGAGAPTKDLGPALQARVDERRRELGLAPVRWSEGLSAIALRNAQASARGKAEPKDWQDEVFALGFVAVESHSLSSIDYEALMGVALWSTPALEAGVGVVRTKDPGGGEGFLAVVLVAERQ